MTNLIKCLLTLVVVGSMAVTLPHPTAAKTLKCKGCVKSKHLKNNGIKSRDIKDGEVKNADLGDGAVDSSKVRDGSLTGSDIATQSVFARDLANGAGADYHVNATADLESLAIPAAATVLRSVSLTAPSAGQVIVNASLAIEDVTDSPLVRCSISKSRLLDSRTLFGARLNTFASVTTTTAGTTWAEPVAPGTHTWNLVCGNGSMWTNAINPALTAIFVPNRY